MRLSEKFNTWSAPRTSWSSSGNFVTWKSSYRSVICTEKKNINTCYSHTRTVFFTWSKYFACTLHLAAHSLQGFSPGRGNRSWLTIMLCVSMPHLVSSWTNRSVSYSERNSAMHTHTKVVWSGLRNCSFTCFMIWSISSILPEKDSGLKSASPSIDPICSGIKITLLNTNDSKTKNIKEQNICSKTSV